MLTTEMIEEYLEDGDEIAIPKGSKLAEMVSISDRIKDYDYEESELADTMGDLGWRMREYGYDGDHDPMEPYSRRMDEIYIMQQHLYAELGKIKLSDDENKVLQEVHSYFEVKAEVEAEAAHERRYLGHY